MPSKETIPNRLCKKSGICVCKIMNIKIGNIRPNCFHVHFFETHGEKRHGTHFSTLILNVLAITEPHASNHASQQTCQIKQMIHYY